MRRSHRKTPLAIAAVVIALAALLTALVTPAQAADEHLFDPVLSLEGDCNGEDGALDPGCVGEPPAYPPASSPTPFAFPCGTAVDRHGNVYTANAILKTGSIVGGRLDVFSPTGEFLLEFETTDNPCGLAVDSEGNLYSGGIEGEIDVFHPSAYPPTPATTYSLIKTFDGFTELGCSNGALAVDPSNDHFYLSGPCRVLEYGTAAAGSPLIGESPILLESPAGENWGLSGIDVYGQNHDIYAAVLRKTSATGNPLPSKVLVLDGSDGHKKCEVLGSDAPDDLDFGLGASVAVDQSNGDIYVYSIYQSVVYQFAVQSEGECEFIGRLSEPPVLKGLDPLGDIAVDGPLEAGEAGYDSPNSGYVYVSSGQNANNSHLYAFKPRFTGPPEIREQVADAIAETEAVLRAELNPNGLETTYHFEYTTQAGFKAKGYEGATRVPAPDTSAGAGGTFTSVSEPIGGLEPDTAYRFRLVASNCEAEGAEPGECLTVGEGSPGAEGEDASFSTYPSAPVSPPCSNAALRIGPSASLPDCRAYELVTPPDTNGRIPKISILGVNYGKSNFDTIPASPDGDSVVFGTNSGSLPGIGGGGFFDTFEALRDEDVGWLSQFTGLTGAQANRPRPGGISPDHGYSFWTVEEGTGSFAPPAAGSRPVYLRVPSSVAHSPNCAVEAEPEGQFEWIGCGSLGSERQAVGKWISEGGGHVVFRTERTAENGFSASQLEPCAPATGAVAIYDRTPGGPTHCVSVPPAAASAETEAQFETKDPAYKGTSADGTAVAFAVDSTLYVRLDNAETLKVATGNPDFGGISADGSRLFYLDEPTGFAVRRGEIYACDLAAGPCAGPEANKIGSGGESALVNISADGSHVYFLSPQQLDGEEGTAGKDNLYVWDGEAVRFIAVLDPADVDGIAKHQGLGLWVSSAVSPDPTDNIGPANVPARTTPDGEVLIFESLAELTGYESNGHGQVFRYDTQADPGKRLRCLSCNPTDAAAGSDARLQNPEEGQLVSGNPSPVNSITQIANVTSDGTKVFFQISDRLVPADLDGKLDVYEWQAQGSGGCEREAGCLSLISSGRSADDEYLFAMTPNGSDVFFLSGDTLVPQDTDSTPSIYDARVGGGFRVPEPPPDCLGEACQPVVRAPDDATPATSSFEGSGNVTPGGPKPRCPKGKRKAKRLSRRAKQMRREAKRANGPRRQKRLRQKAARNANAKRLSRKAKSCRRKNRRAR